MNKKLLSVAVGAALAASPLLAANAAVKVQGRVEVEIVNGSSDLDNAPYDGTEQGDNNGQSRLVFNGSEDLGNGLKAIGRLAFSYDPSDGGDQGNRDAWAGLKGGFGTFKIGRLPGTYKMFGGVKWDPYAATFMQARRAGGMTGDGYGHNGFINDIIEYTTPKLGGFTFQGQYIMDETDGDDGSYMVGAKWKGGPVEVIAAANHHESADEDNAKVGARFKSGGLTAYVQYEDVDNGGSIRANGHRISGASTGAGGSFLLVGAGYKFGNNLLAGNVGGFDADNSGTDVDYFAIGLTHFFSKKTRVYAGYASTDVDGVDNAELLGAGIRFDF
jgi:predicted porin